MENSTRIIFVFILSFIFYSCRSNKTTIVEMGEHKIKFTEKYIIRNDSIFPMKRINKNVVISFNDTSYRKGCISFSKCHKGKLHGEQYIYDGNGEIIFYGEYKNGKKHGLFLRFIKGKVHHYATYKLDNNIDSGYQLNIPFN